MPLIDATLTPGACDGAARDELARRLTEAACAAESIPDDARARARGRSSPRS
jgi:phenylpyruvate tautomerase PptA (4-oxalocrotonate tautomerase family)